MLVGLNKRSNLWCLDYLVAEAKGSVWSLCAHRTDSGIWASAKGCSKWNIQVAFQCFPHAVWSHTVASTSNNNNKTSLISFILTRVTGGRHRLEAQIPVPHMCSPHTRQLYRSQTGNQRWCWYRVYQRWAGSCKRAKVQIHCTNGSSAHELLCFQK